MRAESFTTMKNRENKVKPHVLCLPYVPELGPLIICRARCAQKRNKAQRSADLGWLLVPALVHFRA